MARRCEAAGGPKVEFCDYILGLWREIGYVPGDVEMAAVYDDHEEYTEQDSGAFTPVKQNSNPDSFGGVSIRQIPKETDSGEIMEFLITSGLPETLKDNVVITSNGVINIRNLNNAVCLALIVQLHQKKFFGRKLYCNGMISLTPDKPPGSTPSTSPVVQIPFVSTPAQAIQAQVSTVSSVAQTTQIQIPAVSTAPQKQPISTSAQTSQALIPTVHTPSQSTQNSQMQVTTVSTPSQLSQVTVTSGQGSPIMSPGHFDVSTFLENDLQMRLSGDELVRRHSVSLRYPPAASSLAAEILLASQASAVTPHFNRIRSILAETKNLNEQLSEFGSARESSFDSSSNEDNTIDSDNGFKAMRGQNRGFKKRKASRTPPNKLDFFLKKANTGQ